MTPHRGGYVIVFLMLLTLHFLFWSSCKGADPPLVVLPADPAPPPPPATTQTLSSGQTYAIRATVACTVLASPEGCVEICPRKGPLAVEAVFVPSTGPSALVDFAEPFIYLVRPKLTGTCELIVIPTGGAIIRRTLKVSAGPPVPPTPPDPPAPTDPLAKALQEAYAAEIDPMKATKASQLADNLASVPAIRATGIVMKLSELQRAFSTSDDLICGKGGLPLVRKAISTYIASRMPTTDQAMTDQLWLTAADAYGVVAKSLKGVR